MKKSFSIERWAKQANLYDPKYQPIDTEHPLACLDHPEVVQFLRIRVVQSRVTASGRYPKGAPLAQYYTYYVCPECDDLLRIEPPRERHNA